MKKLTTTLLLSLIIVAACGGGGGSGGADSPSSTFPVGTSGAPSLAGFQLGQSVNPPGSWNCRGDGRYGTVCTLPDSQSLRVAAGDVEIEMIPRVWHENGRVREAGLFATGGVTLDPLQYESFAQSAIQRIEQGIPDGELESQAVCEGFVRNAGQDCGVTRAWEGTEYYYEAWWGEGRASLHLWSRGSR